MEEEIDKTSEAVTLFVFCAHADPTWTSSMTVVAGVTVDVSVRFTSTQELRDFTEGRQPTVTLAVTVAVPGTGLLITQSPREAGQTLALSLAAVLDLAGAVVAAVVGEAGVKGLTPGSCVVGGTVTVGVAVHVTTYPSVLAAGVEAGVGVAEWRTLGGRRVVTQAESHVKQEAVRARQPGWWEVWRLAPG